MSHATSILRSPVVLGLRKSIADSLGWVGRKDLTIQDIRDAAARNDFRLSMISATQSNSGASAYLGFLYAFAGNPDMLTGAMRLVLDPQAAALNLLQPSTRDVTEILPFNHTFLEPTIVTSGSTADLLSNWPAMQAAR